MNKKLGLCRGRHDIPHIEGYVFEDITDVFDFDTMQGIVIDKLVGVTSLDLYVTGLTSALVEVINYCSERFIPLTLWHYNSVTGAYFLQVVNTCQDLDCLVEGGYR